MGERLFRPGETVTVGSAAGNTFPLEGGPACHRLFVARPEGGWLLVAPDDVEGSVSGPEGVRHIADLRGAETRGAWRLALSEDVRGRVAFGGTTFLFQLVEAPPAPARPVLPGDFRARVVEEEDPLFHGLLAVFTTVAAGFMAWVWTTPLPERAEIDEIEGFADLLAHLEPIPLVLPPPADRAAPSPAAPAPPTPGPRTRPSPTRAAGPTDPPPTLESVRARSRLLQVLTGDDDRGDDVVRRLLGDDGGFAPGVALVGDPEASLAFGFPRRAKDAGRLEDAAVAGRTLTGGTVATGKGAAVAVRAAFPVPEASPDVPMGDEAAIRRVVLASQGRIVTCVDQSLKGDPHLDGRVGVGFTVVAGRVTEAHLVSNDTGDAQLGACVTRAVRQLRFDPGLSAEVAELPWIVSGK